ncbi:hypothetical protein M2451_002742 [Dysgonomonas sp. PFB1-18]|uniref:hypothetical protein n=1 Tax=unclassified Dysgonomonas TaxID=2630389 RepID=UPI002474167F|nr:MULTISPECIES: hypothetical protein [unclassified Dysgonomonas]MDH6309372.1 hypothetical protein [Dysgonomonas sp. PF1-14]MDH6339763.1 hypothetical protein [Dysgonomonas sp. PF1-16]MDH6381411.1 hypothetical protein [Dysgonomonas sp. PFB1-18]MDH6398626.1 hypothetical protein [Dysgonomonas sp. PF1-23]
MEKGDYSDKKQHGDAGRIAALINPIRVENGKEPYSLRMINAMLDGKRTMPEYVRGIVDKYYLLQDELKSVLI